MAMDSGSMSPADVAAVVDNRGGYGYGYPVMPMYPAFGGFGGGYGNNFGGDFIWIILLFALFGGWGGGFGGFGGFGGNVTTDSGLIGYALGNNATKGDLTSVQTASKLDSISSQVSNGFANNATQLCNGFSDVQAAIANGAYNINTGLLTGFANTNLNACQNTNAITSAIDNSRFAQQQCCCDIKTAIANSDNLNFRNTCAIENMIQAQTTAMKEDGEKTRSLIIANKVEELERQLSQKDRELQTARFDASQVAQTAAIKAGQVAEIDALYNRLAACPVPTMPVYGMTPIFTCNGWNNSGCGCGSQFVQ